MAGNQLGEFAQVCAVAVGIGALVAASATAFTVIKLLGAAYLVYLGVQTIRSRRPTAPAGSTPAPARVRRWRVFGQAFAVGVTNPKTTVFFAAVLPQFADPRPRATSPFQLLGLGLVWSAIALVCDSGWALAASAARAWLRGRRAPSAGSGGAAAW